MRIYLKLRNSMGPNTSIPIFKTMNVNSLSTGEICNLNKCLLLHGNGLFLDSKRKINI